HFNRLSHPKILNTHRNGPFTMSGSREDVFENNPSVCTCNSTTYEWSCDCAGFTTKTLDGQRCELANFVEAYVECEYPDPA